MTETCETPWPSLYEYALARTCSVCQAEVGRDCDAPVKQREVRLRAEANDREITELERFNLQHAPRMDAASAHYTRDVGKAPWPEERVPGKRYDTLPRPDCACPRQGDLWQCRARPELDETIPGGEVCELGRHLKTTKGGDWWPPEEPSMRVLQRSTLV